MHHFFAHMGFGGGRGAGFVLVVLAVILVVAIFNSGRDGAQSGS